MGVEVRLLGPLEISHDGRAVEPGSGKRRALLAILLLHANEVVPTERLIDDLWGEHAPATATKSVQVYVSQLRKALGESGAILATRGSGYVLNVDPEEIDAGRFAALVEAARSALANGDPEAAADNARRALELWRGPPLYDVAYESFAQNEIARLEELRLVAIETRIEAELELGEHARLAGELEGLVAAHPLRERFRAQLMLALYRCGRQSDALDVYSDGRRRLMDELGLEPGPELRELQAQILQHGEALAAPTRPRRRAPQRSHPSSGDGPGRKRRRAARILTAGAALLVLAAALAIDRRGSERSAAEGVSLDAASHSLVALDAAGKRAVAALPLSGRATDLATDGRSVWATTVGESTLTAIDARSRKIVRTTPLPGRPDAVAIGSDAVWAADGARGVLTAVRRGYGGILRTVRFPPARAPAAVADRHRAPRTAIAVVRGTVWVANGSRRLLRLAPGATRVQPVAIGRRIDLVVAGAGALWALGHDEPRILRIDPRSGRVTDNVPVVARRGPDIPVPTALATGRRSVWVLNGNTATATRIDARTLGVTTTVDLGLDRIPLDIGVSGETAWVSNFDGTLARIDARSSRARRIAVGGSLERVAAAPMGVWASSAALDHQLPGGSN